MIPVHPQRICILIQHEIPSFTTLVVRIYFLPHGHFPSTRCLCYILNFPGRMCLARLQIPNYFNCLLCKNNILKHSFWTYCTSESLRRPYQHHQINFRTRQLISVTVRCSKAAITYVTYVTYIRYIPDGSSDDSSVCKWELGVDNPCFHLSAVT